jgi:hypothetical protein
LARRDVAEPPQSGKGYNMFATIPSSTGQWLACLAWRVHGGGPDMLLRMMRATLTTSDPMVAFERIGAATLAAPARLTCASGDRKPRPPILRIVK